MNKFSRRVFLRNAAANAAGVTLMNAWPSGGAAAASQQLWSQCRESDDLRSYQTQREEFEEFFRSLYGSQDDLDLGRLMAHFTDDILGQDAVTGDLSFVGINGCNLEGRADLRAVVGRVFQHVGTPGKLAWIPTLVF